jgi:hypothetical protein
VKGLCGFLIVAANCKLSASADLKIIIEVKKKVLIIIFILISVQAFARIGENRDFWIISQSDFNNRISKGRDVTLRRYIVVPDFDKNFKEILEINDESGILAKFSFMLKKNKRAWIEKYIENYDSSLEINELILGMFYFSRKQYTDALNHFENIRNEEYMFLKYLLIADCKYELASEVNDFKTRIEVYQAAMDKSNSELERLIINNRIKFIRYN